MRDIRNEVGFLSETMSGVSAIGRTMTFTLTTPLVALGTYAVQAASDFDASMRNINSIAQLSEESLAQLSDRVFEFASTTRAGVVPATDALYEIFSAGIVDVERAMAVWETSTRVAEAGLANLEKTTNAVTATMSAYGFEAKEAARVGDVWTHMVALGVGSLEDFLANSQKVLPLSVALGVSFEDLGASAAYISQQGGGAKKAMTALAMLESNLLKPTEALSAAYAKLGVRTGQELITKFGSLSEAILAVHGAAEDEVDFAKMFSKTGLEAAFAFINNVDASRAAIDEFINTVEGATGRAWDEQMKSFAASFDLFKTAVQAAAISIGEVLLPYLTPIIQKATQWFIAFSQLNPKITEFGVVVAAVVAAAGPLIWILGSILTPAGLLVGAIAGLALAFQTNFDTIKAAVIDTVTAILGEDGFGKLTSMWDTVRDTLFPPEDQPEVIGDIVVPVFAKASDFVKIEEGDTLWDIFQSSYSDQMTWENFRDNVILPNGRTPATLQIGDLIEVPTNLGDQVAGMIAQGFRHSATGTDIPLVALTGGGIDTLQPFADRRNPIAEGIIERLKSAGQIVIEQAPAIFEGVFQNVVSLIMTTLNGVVSMGPQQESIYDPLSGALIPQNTGDLELFQGIKDFITTNVARLILLWNTVKDGLKNLGDGLQGFVDGLNTIDASRAKKAVGDLLTIAGILGLFVGGVIAFGVETVGNIGGYILPELGNGIANIVNTVGALSVGDFKTALSSFSGAITNVVNAGLSIPAGLADTIISFLQDTTNVQMDSSTAETFTTWAGIIENAATTVGFAWETMKDRIKKAWLELSLEAVIRVQELFRTLEPLAEVLNIDAPLRMRGLELAVTEMDIRKELADLQIGEVMVDEINRQLNSTSTSPFMENLNIDTAQGSVGVLGGSFLDQIVNWVNNTELSRAQQQSVANWFNQTLANAIATGNNDVFSAVNAAKGELEPGAIDMSLMSTSIVDGLVNGLLAEQPRIHTAMTDMGNGATKTLKDLWGINSPSTVFHGYGVDLLTGLINGVNEKSPAVRTAFETQFGVKGTVMTTMHTFKSEFATVIKTIVGEIAKITAEATKAANAINALETQAGDGNKPTPRAGGGGVFPGHAYKVGDGVGPELFVPNQVGQVVPMHELRGRGRAEVVSQNNEVHIHGVQDVDKMLYELRRRGIVLK